MINPKLFTVEKLLAAFFDNNHGNRDAWRALASIVPDYTPPYPREDRPRCVVRFDNSFLRYSCGPRQGHFWDVYGDDYLTPEFALIALLEAPIPPGVMSGKVWNEIMRSKIVGRL